MPETFVEHLARVMADPVGEACPNHDGQTLGCWCATLAAVAATGETHGVLLIPETMTHG